MEEDNLERMANILFPKSFDLQRDDLETLEV